MAKRLTRRWYATDAETLAIKLLGCTLVRVLDDATRLSGRIVETEAYIGAEDRASHAFGGRRTPRNESMYAVPGTAYVYFTYGMHHCFNVVCGKRDEPVAVLIRALEPIEGLAHMRTHRGENIRDEGLCSGPARLCQALRIHRSLDRVDLTRSSSLFLEAGDADAASIAEVGRGPRIGLGEVGRWRNAPLRWWIKANPHVSR